MIIRQGGGNSGIKEYLEKGSKFDRHYSRDELDNRIIIDGDLEVTDRIINDIPDNGQERYLHITLSFHEPDASIEKIKAVYEDYKKTLLASYAEDEINVYAEIHQPKTQQLLDKSTGEMYDRFPHIHMVIPKRNLLNGGYTNPTGMYERNVTTWEAIQEDLNNRHGLESPAHSPRISIENYKAVLDRHKASEFKSSTGEIKKDIFNAVESNNIKTWDGFKDIASSYGEVKHRNKGKDNEYLAVKLPGNSRFTNLNNPIFSKQYIEGREIPRKPLTAYQIENRLKRWEVISKEIKYIDDASSSVKKAYRALGEDQRASYLDNAQRGFYEKHGVPEPKPKAVAHKPGYPELARRTQAGKRSLHELPTLAMVHNEQRRRDARTDLLLPTNERGGIRKLEADSDAGLQRPVHGAARVIISKEQIKSLSSQIIFDIEEKSDIEKANDLELFKEIRLNLNPEIVIAYAQSNHLLNPDDHKHFKAKDGSARISFGKYNYNVSDFFTKGIGLEWKETEVVLKALYEFQTSGLEVKPIDNETLKECLINFERNEYSDRIKQYKQVRNSIDSNESVTQNDINRRYFSEIKRINSLGFMGRNERENLKALNTFEKIVAEENLKAKTFGDRQEANAIKYPFSDHFQRYLTQQKVIDMSMIDDLKKKFYSTTEEDKDINTISGKGYDFVLDGKEASRRAKLTKQLENSGQPHTRYGYAFKELRPEQKKDHVVFYKGDEPLFETHSNRTTISGKPDADKIATALAYSMQRYGNPLDINGTQEFREQIIEVSARNGLDVEFTDPALNEALKARVAELALEAGNENSISAQDLELDKSLGERAAIDKALLESKQREIESSLETSSPADNELAAIAIQQRKNAHENEELSADSALKDIELFKELKTNPAMQAYFAVEMSRAVTQNADYRAEFIKNEPEEFMLANHAARQVIAELENSYQANRPSEETELEQQVASADEWDDTIKDADGMTNAVYSAMSAGRELEAIPEQIANDSEKLAAYRHGLSGAINELTTDLASYDHDGSPLPGTGPGSNLTPENRISLENQISLGNELLNLVDTQIQENILLNKEAEIIPEDWNNEPAAPATERPELIPEDWNKEPEAAELIPEDWNSEPVYVQDPSITPEAITEADAAKEDRKAADMEKLTEAELAEHDALEAQLKSQATEIIPEDWNSEPELEQPTEAQPEAAELIPEDWNNEPAAPATERPEQQFSLDNRVSELERLEPSSPEEFKAVLPILSEAENRSVQIADGLVSKEQISEIAQKDIEALLSLEGKHEQLEISSYMQLSMDNDSRYKSHINDHAPEEVKQTIIAANILEERSIEEKEYSKAAGLAESLASVELVRYELTDPRYDASYAYTNEMDMQQKAEQIGSTRYSGIAEDGTRLQFVQHDSVWMEENAFKAQKTLQAEAAKEERKAELAELEQYTQGLSPSQLENEIQYQQEEMENARDQVNMLVSQRDNYSEGLSESEMTDLQESIDHNKNKMTQAGERMQAAEGALHQFSQAKLADEAELKEPAIEVGLTGPDWEPTEATKHYAQQNDVFAFGATEQEAMDNLAIERTRNSDKIKQQVLDAFDKEPAPLSAENAADRSLVDKLQELKAPETKENAAEVAKTLTDSFKELRGKPELKAAAVVAATLYESSPALQSEMDAMTLDNDYTKTVMEAGKQEISAENQKQMQSKAPDFDM